MEINLKVLATTEFFFVSNIDGSFNPNYYGDYIKLIAQASTCQPPFQCLRFEDKVPIHMTDLTVEKWNDFYKRCETEARKKFESSLGTPNALIPQLLKV